VFGGPPAVVFEQEYDGPPVIGSSLHALPALSPRRSLENVTHEVRVDAFGASLEIAPGVRCPAWTFGGSVPGPVLHVLEGDRIIWTTGNRTDELYDAMPLLLRSWWTRRR
jgi:nitrite reductase (NO-forming)